MRAFSRFFAVTVLLSLVLPSAASAMNVKFFLGQVTLSRGGKTVAVKVGDVVGNGDTVKTGKNSMIELSFDANSTITVQADSIVQIGSKNIKDSAGISIVSGEVKGKFGKLKKGEYKIGSPTTVCGVRGTEFDVAVSKGGNTYVVLKEGNLAVRNPYENVDLKQGSSLEADVAERPDTDSIDENVSDWNNNENEDLGEDLDEQAGKYESYMENFEDKTARDAENIEALSAETKNAKTKEELAKSGEKIINSDSDLEDSMMMNEASVSNMENLAQDYEGRDAADRFKKSAEKGNAVMEQQIKNRKAIEKVKADYKEAYDKIMKKFKDDKSNILKNLEDFKKTQPVMK